MLKSSWFALVALVFASAGAVAKSSATWYDMTLFFNEPHPFDVAPTRMPQTAPPRVQIPLTPAAPVSAATTPPTVAPRLMTAAQRQPVPAGPQEFRTPTRKTGYYISTNVGFGFQEDATHSSSFIDLESDSNIGFGFAGAVGYGWLGGLRVEGEIAYREYGLDSLTLTRIGNITGLSIGGFAAEGDVSAFTLMANVAYDFDLNLPFTPFLTGGLGTALIGVNDVKTLGVDVADDSDWVGALQFGGGVVFSFRDRWSLVASYRYLVTTDPELKDSAGDPFDSEFASHNIQFGIRYAL